MRHNFGGKQLWLLTIRVINSQSGTTGAQMRPVFYADKKGGVSFIIKKRRANRNTKISAVQAVKQKISAVQNARRIPLTQTSLFCGRRTFPPALKIFLIITDIRVYPKHPFLPSALLLFCASLRRMAAGVVKFLGNLQKKPTVKILFSFSSADGLHKRSKFCGKICGAFKEPDY